MKYKLMLMFIFSFLVHITIAGALVYVPYHFYSVSHKDANEGVIWGDIQVKGSGKQGAGSRSRKSGIKSQNIEEASMSVPLTKGDENERDKNVPPIVTANLDRRGFLTPPERFSGETSMAQALTKDDGNINILRQAQDDKHSVMELCHSEPCQAELVEAFSNHDEQLGTFSGGLNVNTGSGNGVLLASSTGGHSHTEEGDEIIKAEKGRIYNEHLKALIEQIKKEIEKNKYYPFPAKLRGIEGTVYVNFHIGQDGRPGSIAISKSSGAKILDDSAVKTIMNLKPVRNIHPELRELDVTVPITYRLREGSEQRVFPHPP